MIRLNQNLPKVFFCVCHLFMSIYLGGKLWVERIKYILKFKRDLCNRDKL